MTIKDVMDKVRTIIPGIEQPNVAQCRKAIYYEKDLFLRTWKINDLKEICKEKGLPTTKQDVMTNISGTNINTIGLDFYEIINIIIQKISSIELIDYSKKHNIEYKNFENKVNELTKFYKLN